MIIILVSAITIHVSTVTKLVVASAEVVTTRLPSQRARATLSALHISSVDRRAASAAETTAAQRRRWWRSGGNCCALFLCATSVSRQGACTTHLRHFAAHKRRLRRGVRRERCNLNRSASGHQPAASDAPRRRRSHRTAPARSGRRRRRRLGQSMRLCQCRIAIQTVHGGRLWSPFSGTVITGLAA